MKGCEREKKEMKFKWILCIAILRWIWDGGDDDDDGDDQVG